MRCNCRGAWREFDDSVRSLSNSHEYSLRLVPCNEYCRNIVCDICTDVVLILQSDWLKWIVESLLTSMSVIYRCVDIYVGAMDVDKCVNTWRLYVILIDVDVSYPYRYEGIYIAVVDVRTSVHLECKKAGVVLMWGHLGSWDRHGNACVCIELGVWTPER